MSVFFVFGYKIGRFLSKPEQIWLGERYVLMDRYDLKAYYEFDGSLMGLALYDISNDYAALGEIDFFPSGYVRTTRRPIQDGFVREMYYENGATRVIHKRNYTLGKSETAVYSEDGNLMERTEKDIVEGYDSKKGFKGSPPASYFDYLYFEHSPWDIRANWFTANSKGHIYKYLSCAVPMICLFIMFVTVCGSCIIVLTKKRIFVKWCTIIICLLIDLLMGFAMSWDLFLFHKIQARADLLSDSSACGTVLLYIGVCFALACLILPLIISTLRRIKSA